LTAASNSFVINAVNDAPVLSSTAAVLPNGTEDQSYTIQASDLLQGFSDVDGGTLSVVNLQATNGSLVDNQNGTYSFNPTKDFNGTVQLSYQVSDGKGGFVNATNSFVVDTVNDAPMIGLPLDDQSIDENQPFSFTIPQESFIDIDSNVLNYSAVLIDNTGNETALPSWLSFDVNTKTFSGTPSFDDAGSLRIKVTASDGEYRAEQVFTLDVGDVNRAPQANTAIADKTLNEGEALSYQIAEDAFIDLDADADVLTYSATLADGSALPSWLSFDAATQTFSGTPSARTR
jgi:hypothetical protein